MSRVRKKNKEHRNDLLIRTILLSHLKLALFVFRILTMVLCINEDREYIKNVIYSEIHYIVLITFITSGNSKTMILKKTSNAISNAFKYS